MNPNFSSDSLLTENSESRKRFQQLPLTSKKNYLFLKFNLSKYLGIRHKAELFFRKILRKKICLYIGKLNRRFFLDFIQKNKYP